jgi:hypothetical protein
MECGFGRVENFLTGVPMLSRDCTIVHKSIESNRFVIVISSVCVCVKRLKGMSLFTFHCNEQEM